jgi:hypothetical protein
MGFLSNIALLAPLIFVSALSAAPAPANATIAPIPLPAGVADPAGKIGYLAGARGVIEAVDLDKGVLLWDTKELARPLVAFDTMLAAQIQVPGKPNSVRIIMLDATQKGKKVLESEPVVFPDWVSVTRTHGRSFESQGSVSKGELLLKWRANAFYAGGAPPPPEVVAASRKEATGVARIDLKTGKVTMTPDRAPAETVKLPEELSRVASQQYWTGSDWKTTPFIIGNTVSALAVQNLGGAGTQMSLKRWDRTTGKPLDTVAMLKGKELWPQLSADGKYVFVHQALVKEQLPPGDYAWWVFSLESGKQVSKLPFTGQLTDAIVLGDRLYHLASGQGKPVFGGGERVTPRSIQAVSLKSGKVVWQRPVEGQRFLVPLP